MAFSKICYTAHTPTPTTTSTEIPTEISDQHRHTSATHQHTHEDPHQDPNQDPNQNPDQDPHQHRNGSAAHQQPTSTPTSTATSVLPTSTPAGMPASGNVYYVSNDGNDANTGKSEAAAFKTFNKALSTMAAGDTLLIADGVYTQTLYGYRSAQAGQPFTIKALNDGQAIIDGGGTFIPVMLDGSYYVLEGIIARNGSENVIQVRGNNNTLRRISAYNADPNKNSQVILLWSNNNLAEDILTAGTGRYMFDIYQGTGNVARRVFAMWQRWDGKNFCGVSWPNGNNIGIYNGDSNIVENSIAYGRSLTGIFYQANNDSVSASNNKILGSMALLQGRDYDGSEWTFGTGQSQPETRPGPTTNPYGSPCDNSITWWEYGYQRAGLAAWGQGTVVSNVFSDSVTLDNMGTRYRLRPALRIRHQKRQRHRSGNQPG